MPYGRGGLELPGELRPHPVAGEPAVPSLAV